MKLSQEEKLKMLKVSKSKERIINKRLQQLKVENESNLRKILTKNKKVRISF
ncbi:MAG: hypothetical protein RIC06_04025 [Cyclobacteriaceae bacterium]